MLLALSLIAAFFTTVSFIPQAIKTIKTRNTAGISLGMYALFDFGVLLWFIYGIAIRDIAVASANAVTFIFASIILFYKWNNVRKGGE